jgi:hypothetical protein
VTGDCHLANPYPLGKVERRFAIKTYGEIATLPAAVILLGDPDGRLAGEADRFFLSAGRHKIA